MNVALHPNSFTLTSKAGDLRLEGGPKLVGILNVTPDSFYDGGRYLDVNRAVERGVEMFNAGAAWVDAGGMSTRPGSDEISAGEEIRRVTPVVDALSRRAGPSAWISVDTYRSEVARAALAAGAACINDVSGFTLDPAMCEFAASARCPVVVNHMKGAPKTMQVSPSYDSLWDDLLHFFDDRMTRFVNAGGSDEFLVLDPGIGFGKTPAHNMEILRGLDRLHALGRPIFLGCSRKSFIAGIVDLKSQIRNPKSEIPEGRLPGSLAAAGWAAIRGVHLLRVHDVAETAQFLNLFLPLCRG